MDLSTCSKQIFHQTGAKKRIQTTYSKNISAPKNTRDTSIRDWSIEHIVEMKEEEEVAVEEEAGDRSSGGRAAAKSSDVAIAAFFYALPAQPPLALAVTVLI